MYHFFILMVLFYYFLCQRNDAQYRPSEQKPHYRPPLAPVPDRDEGILSSLSNGFNSFVNNVFG